MQQSLKELAEHRIRKKQTQSNEQQADSDDN
jgi:hypothetical protein